MTPVSLAVLAFSMSADACAAAMARGAATRPSLTSALRGGAVFGAVEAVTPILGWAVGLAASRYIAAVDHWIAFLLLAVVGGKMALEAVARLRNGDAEAGSTDEAPARQRGLGGLLLVAVATSIDAAAVGVTLAVIDVNIVPVAVAIGLASFTMASAGLLIGRTMGARFGPLVELLGGLGLIGIGTSILVSHLSGIAG
ncbi:manganese efflux pump [Sphingomonas ginkgonis]|uniref:Putative manganese efflux pump MntP n=1 Tax=Sphingomonas ginkgonis TaxID=2315330 RepID=A0A429VB62_9SPHN|nr:manganese efflux pump MntP family protein [Sphingomonas ginkgonis]RST31233.1 manganese efflux pump [Sphingomonas ginkgonis]